MAEAYSCQRCGAAVGPEAAQGLCPACLLQAALGDSQAPTLASGAGPGSGGAELAELGRLFPQLEILELIGRGGMGVVYKARQRGLDRLVALKILPPNVDHDPGFRERFVREARALARLTHPNIVAVYDFGQVEGRYYFLMEYVDGANLRRTLQAGHLTPLQAMAIVPQLCDALQFAHEEGIVHRDIKPENILMDRKGRVKIADFGLAKLLGASLQQDPYTLTSPRQVLGTPHYMAPEQFERPGTVDHRADIYSMGVVFYEMLTGELPLGRFPVPSRKVQVDVRLDEVVLRTLEKEPEHRYQRAGDVKTELASLNSPPPVGGPPTWNAAARPPRSDDVLRPSPRLSPLAIAGLVVALIAPVILPVFSIVSINQATYNSRAGGLAMPSAEPVWLTLAAVLAIVTAVVSCWMGISAIRQIRGSGGRYYGLPLALFDAMLYPALAIDVAIATALFSLIDPPMQNAGRIWFLMFLLTLGLDAWVFRKLLRPVARPLAPLPPPVASPRNYALRPRATAIGCFAGLALCVLVIGLFIVALAVPYFQARRAEQLAATINMEQGFISAQGYNDSGPPADSGAYRFQIRSPIDCKTTLWAELWRNGKLVREPGFNSAFWVIPPAGQPFDGVVTFELAGGAPAAQVKVGWKVTGSAGSYLGDRLVADPFAGLLLRDSTWGVWSGQWSSRTGEPIQLLVLRGGKHDLPGSPQDMAQPGAADVEVRLYARFDPKVAPNHNSRILFGESAVPATGAASRPDAARIMGGAPAMGDAPDGRGPADSQPSIHTPPGEEPDRQGK